jgi:PAS domain S-box-containing protein
MKNKALFYHKIFEDSPVGMTICDSSGQAIDANNAICDMVGATKEQILAQNYFRLESWKKSGLLDAAKKAVSKNKATSKKVTLTSSFGKEMTANVNFLPFEIKGEAYMLVTFDDLSKVKKAEDERKKLIVELRNAISEIETLRSILPLCSFCKKIRDDKGYWEQVDVYIQKHLFADISHSICPECFKKHYPQAYKSINKKKKK